MGGATGSNSDVAPVRTGEDLDWVSLEAYLREALPELRGRLLRPAVPARLGQPDLSSHLR